MPPKIARFDTGEEPIDGYVLVEFLGRGQFGEVWKARDKASGRLLAVKIIDLTFSPTALKELRAFKLVKNLNHPNLIPIFTARLKNRRDKEVDFDKADALPKGDLKELVIVMGLGEKSLSQRLKELNADGTPPDQRQGLPLPELIRFMRGAAKGIDFLNHPDHGVSGGAGDGPIIHCDIKPENLMIVAGEVQIADCGVAVIISPDMRQTRAAGSPAYSAPELSGNKPGPGTDQYALAISYYELRTGRLPFPEEASLQQIILAHALGDLDFSAPVLSDAERDVLRRATSRVPADRFESCDEFVEELSGLPDVRAVLKAHRRSSTHMFPASRGSDDFRLPGTGHTPMGDGTGMPAPGRLSDAQPGRQSGLARPDSPPRATPQLSPATDTTPARPGSAPPRPKDGAVDYDVAAQDEPAPRPDTASWKEFVAAPSAPPGEPAPPGRDGGTLHFELPESKPADQPTVPTPWLPFPAPRAPSGPPPGLMATTVVPDILPQPDPAADQPTAGRETHPPTPSTDTPREGVGRPTERPGPGASGMPVNPDDPLGKRYAPAEPDTIIRGIIAGAPEVKGLPPRTAEPAVPPVAKKPDISPKVPPGKKRGAPKQTAPPKPPAVDESVEASKPAWFKEAAAEEARRKSGPVPGKKPTPVFLPAVEAKKSGPKAPAKPAPTGDWRKTDTGSGGGNGKTIAMIAAGVVAFAGLGIAIYAGFSWSSNPEKELARNSPVPPPPIPDEPPGPAFDEKNASDRLAAFLGVGDFAAAEKFVDAVADAPAAWREEARTKVTAARDESEFAALQKTIDEYFKQQTEEAAAKARAAIDGLPQKFAPRKAELVKRYEAHVARLKDPEFTAAWSPIKGAASPEQAARLVGARLVTWDGDEDRKKKLVANLVEKYDAETTVRGRGKVAEVLRQRYPYTALSPEHRQSIAEWRAADLLAELSTGPATAFRAMDSSDAAKRDAAKTAMATWLKDLDAAAMNYGPEWPADKFKTGQSDVLRRWHDAATLGSAKAFDTFKEVLARPEAPDDAAVVVSEYFRLAGSIGSEAVAQLRTVRDHARDRWKSGLTPGQAEQVDARFQALLAEKVKAHVTAVPPRFEQIKSECAGDHAGGWAKAAEAESILPGKKTEARGLLQESARSQRPDDVDLSAYLGYLNGLALADPAAAADQFVKAYTSPPTFLKTTTRVAAARTALLAAAEKAFDPQLANPPKLELLNSHAPDWLATVESLNPDARALVLTALVRYERNDSAQLKRIIEQLERNNGFTIASVPELEPTYRVLYCLARASLEPQGSIGRMTAYADVSESLAEWLDRDLQKLARLRWEKKLLPGERNISDGEYKRQRQAVLSVGEQLFAAWVDEAERAVGGNPAGLPRAQKLAYARLLMHKNRYLAKNPLTFELQLSAAGTNSRKVLEFVGHDATPELYAVAAYVAIQRFEGDLYNLVQAATEDRVDPAVIAAWNDTLRFSEKALAADRSNRLANWVLGFSLFNLRNEDRYRWIHAALRKAEELGPAAKYDPSSSRLAQDVNRYLAAATAGGDRKTMESQWWHIRGKHLFDVTARNALNGRDKEELRREFGDAAAHCRTSLDLYPLYPFLVLDVMGSALEDRAWMADSPEDFRAAVAAMKEAVEEVDPRRIGGQPQAVYFPQYLKNLGRCQYRAAVYGPVGGVSLSEAIDTLKRVQQALPRVATPGVGGTAAESAYWLGKAHWAAGETSKAAAAFETAAAVDVSRGSAEWIKLAVYDNARMAAGRASDGAIDLSVVKKGAERLNELEGERSLRVKLLAALATARQATADGKPADAVKALEAVAEGIENAHAKQGEPDGPRLQADVTYTHTLLELVDTLATSRLPVGNQNARRMESLQQSMRDYPWILTRAEKERTKADLRRVVP